MRTWMLIAVAAVLAVAQEPPKLPAEPPKAEEKVPEEKLPAPLQQKKFEALDRALRRMQAVVVVPDPENVFERLN